MPDFARDLDSAIVQLHSRDYRNPMQLRPGGVLVVGAGNSGAEIALELARTREVSLAGRQIAEVPINLQSLVGRRLITPFLFRVVFHRLLTKNTPIGVKVLANPNRPFPLIRVKSPHLKAAGVVRTPRVTGVQNGRPQLEDGRVLDVPNIIWSTGFHSYFNWIKLRAFDAGGEPKHTRGVATDMPGIYFVGLNFLYALSSVTINGVGRDAKYVARVIAERSASGRRVN